MNSASFQLFTAVVTIGQVAVAQCVLAQSGATPSLLVGGEPIPNAAPNGDVLYPPLSYDGRYIAFHSTATNLTDADNNGVGDVFVVDRTAALIKRLSIGMGGTEADGMSTYPSISGNGAFVAFTSEATNLVPLDGNGASDVFVADVSTGAIEIVSAAPSGDAASGPSYSYFPAISEDGSVVVFNSEAADLVPGDDNGTWDVFVRDRNNGTVELVSKSSEGIVGNGPSMHGVVSGNGRYIAFHSQASNLVSGDINDVSDVFLHDRQTGETTLISRATDGTLGNARSERASITESGLRISYSSDATNLVVDDTNQAEDVFVYDQSTHKTIRVSVGSGGEQLIQVGSPKMDRKSVITPDGTAVAFRSGGDTLVAAAGNSKVDIFLHSIASGETQIASAWPNGQSIDGDSEHHAVNFDGSVVAFSVVVPKAVALAAQEGGGAALLSLKPNLDGGGEGTTQNESIALVWDRGTGKRNFVLGPTPDQ